MSDFEDIFGESDPELDKELSGGKAPDFNQLFDEGPSVDINKEEFAEVTVMEQDPDPAFKNPKYYNKVLAGVGEEAQRLHAALARFLKSTESKEKTDNRMRLMPAFWNFYEAASEHMIGKASKEKRLLLRFALLLPKLISRDQQVMLSKVVFKDNYHEPVHYIDEWLLLVASGEVNPLAVDEAPVKRVNSDVKQRMEKEKLAGNIDARVAGLRSLAITRRSLEGTAVEELQSITSHMTMDSLSIEMPYSAPQKAALANAMNKLKDLQKMDRDYQTRINEVKNLQTKLDMLDQSLKGGGASAVSASAMRSEIQGLRQMHKMCVGRQGNHFPLLMKSYFSANLNDIATREQVLKVMKDVEALDPGVFKRTFRNQTLRIVPHTIIIPCYGDKGICWEPYEKFNKASSRGRIAIPMFPKKIRIAVLYALADLRWEVAKAKAQYYWMEEGLTGRYYQWFDSRKMKGDVRLSFIEDYILWIDKESEGTQKLDKEVRGIFWRNIPFPKERKEFLKKRGFVYSELSRKDSNIAMSDGY